MTFLPEPKHWVPEGYQETAIAKGVSQAALGLFMDPGMGKTATVLAMYDILKDANLVGPMLVVAPLRVCYSTWPEEIKKWENFKHLTYIILHGPDKEERLNEQADIYIINYEGLIWLLEAGQGRLDRLGADVLCLDESTKIKNSQSKRFKALRPVINTFKRRWILSGTPLPNGLLDLFSQMFVLDGGQALGRYITHFRNKWFYQSGYGGYTWEPMEHAYEEIIERIRPLCVRFSIQDYLDMPELHVGNRWDRRVGMPSQARKLYNAVRDEFIAATGGGTIFAPNSASMGIKCRQVANGAVYLTETNDEFPEEQLFVQNNRPWEHVHDVKIEDLKELVEDLQGAPLLLFYEFDHDRQRILGALKDMGVECITGTNATKGADMIERFKRGLIPVLLCQPQSTAHGLNLQDHCHHVAFFGLTWDLDVYIQGIRRVWRRGQEFAVVVYRIIAMGTYDEDIAVALGDKEQVQNMVMEALK